MSGQGLADVMWALAKLQYQPGAAWAQALQQVGVHAAWPTGPLAGCWLRREVLPCLPR